jgi:hypothetical protein
MIRICRTMVVFAMSLLVTTAKAESPRFAVVATLRGATPKGRACVQPAVGALLRGRGFSLSWLDDAHGDLKLALPSAKTEVATVVSLEIDASDSTRIKLTFGDPSGSSPIVRDVPLLHGLDEVGCEAVADIVESTVILLAALPSPAPAPQSVPAPPSASVVPQLDLRPDAAFGLTPYSVEVDYTANAVAWNLAEQGLEISIGKRATPRRGQPWLRLAYQFPTAVATALGPVRWQQASLSPGWSEATRGRNVWFETGGTFGVDLTYIDPPATVWFLGPSHHFGGDLSVSLRSAVGLRLGTHEALYAALVMTLGGPSEFDIGGQSACDIWLWFRPGLLVGIRWL